MKQNYQGKNYLFIIPIIFSENINFVSLKKDKYIFSLYEIWSFKI
jgi:hypothetical protein